MPAPYPLLEMPPGDFKNMFDYQAINMAAAHNTFIQGINAIVAHALTVENIHHHHELEETFYFPEMEKKLGKGALSDNVAQHHAFVPQLVELQQHLEEIKAGKTEYDGRLIVEKIHSFGDTMIDHLNTEIPTLESGRMRAVFTEKELKDIEAAFMKLAMANIEFSTALPLSVVCGNPATPWFPPFPAPLKWATRWWFSRKYSEAWQFGPLNLYGNPRVANA
ncbi:hypothetical protein B0H10DRAFT_2034265 [Mycena sp. CBHHK59/15]|nr:hypothetical protein B0H10DRAFT_2034265 [Mycena sp. CBHHK59/15]